MNTNSFTVYFFDGSYQVVNPSEQFDHKYKHDLAYTIANGRRYSLTPIPTHYVSNI